MKKILPAVLILTAFVFTFAAAASIACAEVADNEFIAMYKGFFRDIQAKNYQKAWDIMTLASKNTVAKWINDEAVRLGKGTTQTQVLDMLENNTNNVRTIYFDSLNTEWEKSSFFQDMNTADFSVKTSNQGMVIITIFLNNEPKDFRIMHEKGRWKINFFEDLML